jgi:hypothetical protein
VDDETEHRAGRATTDHGLAIEVPPGRGPSEVDGETEVGLGRAAAESGFEIEGMPGRGPSAAGGVSEDDRERATIERRAAIASDTGRGPLDRYADEVTARLSGLAATFEDVQLMRMRRRNRLQQELLGPDATDEEIRRVLDKHPELEPFVALERAQEKLLQKAMQNHALYPWLKQYRGLAGPRTARIIAAIGDPWRFPGQQCTGCTDDEGARVTHTFRPVFEVGVPCPVGAMDEWTRAEREDALEIYVGRTRTPRSKTGVRSIWHYFGLMPDETGRLVKLRKGKQASYNPAARVLVLGTNGPADQIVKQRTPKYRDIYDHYKETHPTNDEYPKWRIDSIAKTRASKAFIGDMLTEWKRRSPLDAETVVPSPSDANDE